MKKIDLCIVDVEHLSIYDFASSQKEAEDKLVKAQLARLADINTWENHCKNYPDATNFKSYLETARNKKYQIMTYDEFLQTERERFVKSPISEIDEERFEEMLNVLPPLKWCSINNIEMFCMSEMLTGPYTSQYLHDKNNNKFYHKIVDITDRETWGHNFI